MLVIRREVEKRFDARSKSSSFDPSKRVSENNFNNVETSKSFDPSKRWVVDPSKGVAENSVEYDPSKRVE